MNEFLTKKEQWELVIPTMGIFALARNLRNFDEAGVAKTVKKAVAAKFEDPEVIAKSRMFPYRWFSAYKEVPSLDWSSALETALELSCSHIPEFPGRTLVLIDTSGSMAHTVSDKSKIKLYEIASLFGASLAKKGAEVDTVIFGTDSKSFDLKPGESVLKYVERVQRANGVVGHGTLTWKAVVNNYKGQDRVVILTDEQAMDSVGKPNTGYGYGYGYGYGWNGDNDRKLADFIAKIPIIHAFNLAGYKVGTLPVGRGRFTMGGFGDQSFDLMVALETSVRR